MHYDVLIIGAGMSALAAGIRLAYFGKKVCLVERHYAIGGLNSYYRLGGREYDVGLHALTNYVPPGGRHTPLPRVLHQLRLPREDFDLCEQLGSEIRFPHNRLGFNNNPDFFLEQVAESFPADIDGLRRVVALVKDHGYDLQDMRNSARRLLRRYISSPVLIDMILCPLMYYGAPREHDMNVSEFAILFQSIFCEGFARPRGGVRTIIKTLVKKFRSQGGELRTKCGVERINVDNNRATSLTLETGETLTADVIFSSAGYLETMNLCSGAGGGPPLRTPGRLSFVESISILDTPPARVGLDKTIVFFNDADRFTYARPDGLIDCRSGVICCPNNYERHDDLKEGVVRVTCLANFDQWMRLDEGAYTAAKREAYRRTTDRVTELAPGFRPHVVASDLFTPRTIKKYTGRLDGAVYGIPHKRPRGETHLENLFICGTDQGLVGIIGALLSGLLMANEHGFPHK
jgi:phytoene dehydrogenase-like protein